MPKTEHRWQEAQEAEIAAWRRWHALRPEYKTQLADYWHWYLERIARYVSFTPQHRVLDIGCGPDGIINYIPAGRRFGLDPLMEIYLSMFEMNPAVVWRAGTMERLPFESGSFDVVITTNTLDHTHEPREGLKEIHRILKPGGALVLTVNCYPPVRRLLRLAGERMGRGDRPHPHNYSRGQVRALLRAAHFDLVSEEQGIGTMGVWFYEKPAATDIGLVHRVANILFSWEERVFGYSCIDFIFIARKGEHVRLVG